MFKRMIIFIIFSMLVFSVPAYCDDADTKESSETKQEEKSNSEEEAGSKPDPTSKDDTHVSSSQQSSSSPYVISNLKPQYETDIQTGRSTASIPLSVSPGRAGIQPNLSLSYTSGGSNTYCGAGWNLELGSVIRLGKRKGVPSYDDSKDVFLLTGQELVSIGNNEYRPKIESGFSKIIYNGTYWLVTDKSGTKYYFGQEDQSRLTNQKGTFKWCLDKVIDTNSNYMKLTYQKDQGQIYPQEVKYTGNETTGFSPTNTVTFVLETRPKVIISSFSGSKVVTAKRLSEIQVDVLGLGRVRSYKLEYSDQNYNSLLTKVTQYGQDATSTLPAVTFDYDEKQPQ